MLILPFSPIFPDTRAAVLYSKAILFLFFSNTAHTYLLIALSLMANINDKTEKLLYSL